MMTRIWTFYMKDEHLYEIMFPFKIKDVCEARKQVLYMRNWPNFKGKFIFAKSSYEELFDDEMTGNSASNILLRKVR